MEQEQRRVGASYLFSFYNDVQALTNYYSEYRNIISGLRKRYPHFLTPETSDDDTKLLSEQDQQTVITAAYNLVFFSHKAFIQYKTINNALLKIDSSEVNKYYEAIKNEVIPSCDAVEGFVVALNQIIFNNVVQEALKTNQDLINEIYGSPQNERDPTNTRTPRE